VDTQPSLGKLVGDFKCVVVGLGGDDYDFVHNWY
jgi:hypothetical protein